MHNRRLLRQVFLPFAAAALCACTEGPTPLTTPDPLGPTLGEWNYASALKVPEAPSLNTGLRVTIVIHSLDTGQFRGRVAFWFAGDVGVPPSAFGPVTGSLDQDSAVTMRIPFNAPDAPAITIVGTVAGDVLTSPRIMARRQRRPVPQRWMLRAQPFVDAHRVVNALAHLLYPPGASRRKQGYDTPDSTRETLRPG